MSAYLVNPEQIGILAAYAARGPRNAVLGQFRNVGTLTDAESCATNLALACIESLKARYPNDVSGLRPGPAGMSDGDYVINAAAFASYYSLSTTTPVPSPVAVLRMVKCYEYQACEVQNWETSDAAVQVRWIVDKALAALPGYESAPRDYTDPKGAEALDALPADATFDERVAALFGEQPRPVLLSSLARKK